MSTPTKLPVVIQSNKGATAAGMVEFKTWTRAERTRRGLKAWGITWGLALVAVFLPILHFVLVPLLLIAGPVMFFSASAQEEVILGGQGTCPDCGRGIALVRSKPKWPLSDLCNHCQAPLQIRES